MSLESAAAAVRADLLARAWTVEGVASELGEVGGSALARDDLVALRWLGGHSDLTRLFLLGDEVEDGARWEPWLELGLLEGSAGAVRAALELRPHPLLDGSPAWVVADLSPPQRPGVLGAAHVTGVGPASLQLVAATPRTPVGSAWDLGTGGGVQALHLVGHADRVTATDLDPRALHLTRMTHLLSGLPVPDLRAGSFTEPVAADDFDLVVGNPPFVVGPPRDLVTYRDGGSGDAVTATLVPEVAAHLRRGGTAVLMASWQDGPEATWADRVAEWLPAGFDAWVVQRSRLDPAEHAALWLRDGGGEPTAAEVARWLDWARDAEVRGIGYGLVALHRPAVDAAAHIVIEESAAPLHGDDVIAWQRWCEHLRSGEDLARTSPALHPEARLEQVLAPGADGWETGTRWLTDGRRHVEVDAAAAAVIGALDGHRPLWLVLEVAETVHGVVPADARAGLADLLRTGLVRLSGQEPTGPRGTVR